MLVVRSFLAEIYNMLCITQQAFCVGGAFFSNLFIFANRGQLVSSFSQLIKMKYLKTEGSQFPKST